MRPSAEFGMRNSECGVRNVLILAGVLMILLTISGVAPAANQRTWTRSEVLAVADAEAKRLGYDVEQMRISINGADEWCGHKPESQKGWSVYYASLNPLTMGGDLCIMIDRETGNVIESYTGE